MRQTVGERLNNGRATYRCKHPAIAGETDAGSSITTPPTLPVREDQILNHLPALLVALDTAVSADDDPSMTVAVFRQLDTTLIYDHNDKTVTADSDNGPIRIKLR